MPIGNSHVINTGHHIRISNENGHYNVVCCDSYVLFHICDSFRLWTHTNQFLFIFARTADDSKLAHCRCSFLSLLVHLDTVGNAHNRYSSVYRANHFVITGELLDKSNSTSSLKMLHWAKCGWDCMLFYHDWTCALALRWPKTWFLLTSPFCIWTN